ncbi:MAG: sigma 54-interacting transcriptional regulator, partial [Myxococcota bacterium]|nr:sigma 54-interacting transcriptional regulator [Myxococcota bacterium]
MPLKNGQRYTVGREITSDIVLDYPWVSQRHAVIIGGDPPKVVDLGSRNGTSVDSRAVIPGTPRLLASGNVVGIAGVSLLVQRGGEAEADAWRRGGADPGTVAPQPASSHGGSGHSSPPLFTQDPRMQELCVFAERVAPSDVSVLILGETGVGKELFARSIHEHSKRGKQPLVVLNCAAIPENLVESELFGYERGAFTGATSPKPGLFEAAHESTLFLDEVGELPLPMQAKLLRVLETGEVQRLGSLRTRRVDVRLVAATNRDLGAAIAAGTFRLDLFYRLNGISLSIPPLRERREDIVALADHFASALMRIEGPLFTPEARAALLAYAWPGNVRELKSTIQRAALLAQGGVIDAPEIVLAPAPWLALGVDAQAQAPASLPFATTPPMDSSMRLAGPESGPAPSTSDPEQNERRRIQEALDRMGGNQKDAAKLLGISRRTLIKRLDRYELARPRKRPRLPNDSGERSLAEPPPEPVSSTGDP